MTEEKHDIELEESTTAFYDMLSSSLRPFSKEQMEIMHKAFTLAYEAHKGTRRKSGEPYIMHPIAVAKIVAHEIGLGYKSITAALLHDVVEDTEYTTEDIEGLFGEKISFLVDGLTKLDNIFDGNVSIQAENFRKMMVAMADDIRVVLIKLADRLHNMRTLASMAPHKREKIASETIYLYAPLAHRLGLYNIKTEMEDLTMKFQFPKIYEELQAKIAATSLERNTYIKHFINPISQKLKENNFDFEISGRVKSVYSIWKKMETKQIPFEEIYDLFAVRIVFKHAPGLDEKQQCWNIFSLVTDIYQPNYERLRDWLTTPKDNGYEALHITVMGPQGRWVELQIRSERMNEIAERGYASHWKYKEKNDIANEVDAADKALDSWLTRVREMLANNEENATEFLDQFKLNLFTSEITVYSPKGKVVKLPKQSTALDFAYEIHTKIGNRAIGAKVNHKLVPLNYLLSSGDQVEMLTADNQKPQTEWLNFAVTSRARNHIKAALKTEIKEHFKQGKKAVEEAIKEAGAYPNAMLYRQINDAYGVRNKEELFSKVGAGMLSIEEIDKIVRKQRRSKFLRYMELQLLGSSTKRRKATSTTTPEETPKEEERIDKKAFLLKEGTDPSKLAYRIAQCCNPIPGDSVVGFLEKNNKVLIHKKSCPIAIREASQHGDKIVNAKWTEHKVLSFLARIKVSGIDRIGMLQEMLKVISNEMQVNIRRLNAESHDGLFEDEFDIYVHSTTELNSIITKLQKTSGVEEVKRIESVD